MPGVRPGLAQRGAPDQPAHRLELRSGAAGYGDVDGPGVAGAGDVDAAGVADTGDGDGLGVAEGDGVADGEADRLGFGV